MGQGKTNNFLEELLSWHTHTRKCVLVCVWPCGAPLWLALSSLHLIREWCKMNGGKWWQGTLCFLSCFLCSLCALFSLSHHIVCHICVTSLTAKVYVTSLTACDSQPWMHLVNWSFALWNFQTLQHCGSIVLLRCLKIIIANLLWPADADKIKHRLAFKYVHYAVSLPVG